MLYQLRNLACVHIHHIASIVDYLVSQDRTNVVRDVGEQLPNGILRLVLPLLALDVVLHQVCELELACEREVCLV